MREKILIAVRTAIQNSSRKVRVTFRREAIRDLQYLLGMQNSGIIRLPDVTIILAVISGNSWDGERNRTMVIELAEKFDEEWFVSRMGSAVESVSYAQPKTKN